MRFFLLFGFLRRPIQLNRRSLFRRRLRLRRVPRKTRAVLLLSRTQIFRSHLRQRPRPEKSYRHRFAGYALEQSIG